MYQFVMVCVFQQECVVVDGLEELFMEVQGNGIYQFQIVKVVVILFRQQQGVVSGCVNVQLDLMFCSDIGDVVQWVDSVCVGGVGGGDDCYDLFVVSLCLCNFCLQVGYVYLCEFVGFYQCY